MSQPLAGRLEFNVGQLLGNAWKVFLRNAAAYVVAMIIAVVASVLLSKIVSVVSLKISYIIIWAVGGPFMLGLAKMSLEGVRGRPVIVNDIFYGFSNFINAFLTIVLVSLFCFVGLIGCFVGIFFVWTLYVPVWYFLYDRPADFWTTMEASRKLVMENYTQWLLVALVVAGLSIVGSIPFGLGHIITAPMAALVIAQAYEQAYEQATLLPSATPETIETPPE